MGSVLTPLLRAEYEDKLHLVRTHLDHTPFAAAWAEGQMMALEHAIHSVLDGVAG
jgi:hypothetical protein